MGAYIKGILHQRKESICANDQLNEKIVTDIFTRDPGDLSGTLSIFISFKICGAYQLTV